MPGAAGSKHDICPVKTDREQRRAETERTAHLRALQLFFPDLHAFHTSACGSRKDLDVALCQPAEVFLRKAFLQLLLHLREREGLLFVAVRRVFLIRAGDTDQIRHRADKYILGVLRLPAARREEQRLHHQLAVVIQQLPFSALARRLHLRPAVFAVSPDVRVAGDQLLFRLVDLTMRRVADRRLRVMLRLFGFVLLKLRHRKGPRRHRLCLERLCLKGIWHLACGHAGDVFLEIDLDRLAQLLPPDLDRPRCFDPIRRSDLRGLRRALPTAACRVSGMLPVSVPARIKPAAPPDHQQRHQQDKHRQPCPNRRQPLEHASYLRFPLRPETSPHCLSPLFLSPIYVCGLPPVLCLHRDKPLLYLHPH